MLELHKLGERAGHVEEIWNYKANSSILHSPKIADIDGDGKQEIIFGTKNGTITVMDTDGRIKWEFSIANTYSDSERMFLDAETTNSITATPAVEDINFDGKKEILFGTEDGMLRVLSSVGKELWTFKTAGAIRGSPTVQLFANKQAGIVVASADKNIYFLAGDGRMYWKFTAPQSIEAAPAIIQGKELMIICGSNDGTIYCLNMQGKCVWTYKTGNKVIAQGASIRTADLTKIIIGSTDGTLYCIDEFGRLIWQHHTNGAILSKAVIDDINNDGMNEIVFGSCDNCVHVLDSDGKELWKFETDFWIGTSPIVIDIDGDGKKEIIIGSYDHTMYIIDTEGTYLLDYMPGVSGIIGQYTEGISRQPGKTVGKKIWQYQTDGIIVGCEPAGSTIMVAIESGNMIGLVYKK